MQKRILVVRTDRVGDVIMITPMLRELRKTFPDSYIAALVNDNTQDVLAGNPRLNQIIIDDLKKESYKKVINEIRAQKFTHGLLVLPTKRAAYQMFRGRIKKRIGTGRKLYEVITLMKSVSRNKYIPLRHEADYCMDLARAIGVKTDNITPEIFVSEEEKKAAAEVLREAGISEGGLKIIVHTGSGKSSSNWSEAKYFELIKQILSRHGNSRIILTAKEMSDNFRSQIRSLNESRIIIVDDKLRRLRDLIRIIANADLLIASSTGPLHIASALGIRTIGIYCHRRMNCPQLWGALGDRAVNLEVSKIYCDNNCSADKEVCMFENGISLFEVLKHV